MKTEIIVKNYKIRKIKIMKNLVMSIILGLMICIIFNTVAFGDDIKLYKDFSYGTSKGDILKIKDIYDCSDEIGEDALGVDNNTFAGLEMSLVFIFSEEKLVKVSLIFDYDEDKYIKLFGAINSKFTLISIHGDDKQLDLITLYKKEPGNAMSKINDFENIALGKGNITYIFFDKENSQKFSPKVSNALELIQKSAEDAREVDFEIISDEDDVGIFISFIAPKKVMNILQDKLKNTNVEDF